MIFKTLAKSALALSFLLMQFTSPETAETGANSCDGFWWNADKSVCVPGLPTIKTWYTPAPPYSQGSAVWYAPRVMEATAEVRQLSLDGFVDGVSLMSPSDIGRTVWLRRPDHGWEGPFLVVDCARRGDIWPVIMSRGEVVEVGFQTAAKWGMVNATKWDHSYYDRPFTVKKWKIEGVEVLKMDAIPPWIGEYTPLDYVEWWGDRATFSSRYETYPVGLNPKYFPEYHPGWLWKGGDEPVKMGAYDDWFAILFGDDPRYEFDLPNNYEAFSYKWRCIIGEGVDCSPGFRHSLSID